MIVSTITWCLFIIGTIFAFALSIPISIAAALLVVLITCVVPSKRLQIRLLSSAKLEPLEFFSLLGNVTRKGDLEFHKSLEVAQIIKIHSEILRLETSLSTDPNFENTGSILVDYVESLKKFEGLISESDLGFETMLGHPKSDTMDPATAFRSTRKRRQAGTIFEQPGQALRFLLTYPLHLAYCSVLSPFAYGLRTIQTLQEFIASKACDQCNNRIEKMKEQLSSNRREIEQVIRDFEKFQTDQKSLHQQTKALRDELAQELESVRITAEKYHNEAQRLREYVGLVRARSQEMDKSDPLAEMKALLAEIRKPAAGANGV